MSTASNSNFIDFHVLVSHPANSINRDQHGSQKTMIFGGEERARVSSQSLKQAIRNTAYFKQKLGDKSDRTRELGKLVANYSENLKYDFSVVRKTIELLSGKENIEADGKGTIMPWTLTEVDRACGVVAQGLKESLDDKQLAKRLEKETKELKDALKGGVDIALYGRMVASGVLPNIDGALSVAHSFTTHIFKPEIDWFSAIDEFTGNETGKLQSGHIDEAKFGSGVFYRYASLNIGQLAKNLGVGRKEALELASHIVTLLATTTPSGKQKSFAAYNLADYVLVQFTNFPMSLANAFETPIKRERGGGYLQSSISAMEAYLNKMVAAYEGVVETSNAVFSLEPSSLENKKNTIKDLQKWIAKG